MKHRRLAAAGLALGLGLAASGTAAAHHDVVETDDMEEFPTVVNTPRGSLGNVLRSEGGVLGGLLSVDGPVLGGLLGGGGDGGVLTGRGGLVGGLVSDRGLLGGLPSGGLVPGTEDALLGEDGPVAGGVLTGSRGLLSGRDGLLSGTGGLPSGLGRDLGDAPSVGGGDNLRDTRVSGLPFGLLAGLL